MMAAGKRVRTGPGADRRRGRSRRQCTCRSGMAAPFRPDGPPFGVPRRQAAPVCDTMGGQPGPAEQFGQDEHGHQAVGQRPAVVLRGLGRRPGQPPGRIHPYRDDGTGGQARGGEHPPGVRRPPGAAHWARAGAGDGANRWMVAVRSTAGT